MLNYLIIVINVYNFNRVNFNNWNELEKLYVCQGERILYIFDFLFV